MMRLAAILMLALASAGCADLDDRPGPRLRPCTECYYVNTSGAWQSLYLPDGRVVPVPAGTRVDLDEMGIRSYVVREK